MPSPADRNLTVLPTKTVKPTRRRQTRHFTQLDQVTPLVAAREADPDLGFMARLLALCRLWGRSRPYVSLREDSPAAPADRATTAGALGRSTVYHAAGGRLES